MGFFFYTDVKKIITFLNKIYFKKKYTVYERYIFILISIFVVFLYLIFTEIPAPDNHFSICIFKNITGVPCAACGTTRGLKYFVRGYFEQAFYMNPLSYFTVIVAFVLIIWIIRDFIKKEETFFPFLAKKIPIPIIFIIIILTALNWYWNILKGN